MKTIVVSAVSIVLVSIFFCPMILAAPSMPADLQIVQPDPSLPKELAAFWGKWECTGAQYELFIIVEKIDEEKASLYIWRSGFWPEGTTMGWERNEAKVIKERGKYKLWNIGRFGNAEYTIKGEYLIYSGPQDSSKLKRVE